MHKILVSIGSVLITLLPAAPAFAQDFDGRYAGVQVGWGQGHARNPGTDLGTMALDDERQSTGGFFAGYDRPVGPSVVVGVEAGLDLSTDDAVESANGLVDLDPEWSLDLAARAGYLIHGQTLAYLRGGYTSVRVETTIANGTVEISDTENRNGWLLGAGVERQLLHRISGRLEYRYSDLSEGDGSYARHRILAGIACRF